MGLGPLKKKIKRVTEVLVSKRVVSKSQNAASNTPATPTKKDKRAWLWGSPGKSTGGSVSVPQNSSTPLPSLYSAFDPSTYPGQTTPTAPAPVPDPTAPNTISLTPALSAALPHATQPYVDPPPAHDDSDSDASESDDEAAEPDDQDGVAGNYHHVSRPRITYQIPTLTVCSLRRVHTNS